jgi:hypothetical protein
MRKALTYRSLMAFLAVVTGLLIGNAWLGYQTIQQMRQAAWPCRPGRKPSVQAENRAA